MTLNIAIVGSGIAGLSTSYYLLKNDLITIDLYEKDNIGGHAHTINVDGELIDIGFQVFNYKTYPNLIRLFDELNIPLIKSDMSYSVMHNNFVWSSKSILSIIYSLFNIKFLIILWYLYWFFIDAKKFINSDTDLTILEFCNKYKYNGIFMKYYLIPLCVAIWSTSEKDCEDLSAYSIFKFMDNHSLLTFFNEDWYTLKFRSIDYVEKLINSLPKNRFNLIKESVLKINNNKTIITNNKISKKYDKIIIATNCHQVLDLLDDNLKNENLINIFNSFKSTENTITIHKDISIMPKNKLLWASWNSLISNNAKPIITYWVKSLQHIKNENLFITLNSNKQLNNIVKVIKLSHPLFNKQTEYYKKLLIHEQGKNDIYYCGAYLYNGFHEDGLNSGLDIVKLINNNIYKIEVLNNTNSIYLNIILYYFRGLFKIGNLKLYYRGNIYTFGNGIGKLIELYIKDNRFFNLILTKEDLGFAEAYIEQYFEVNDLFELLQLIINNTSKNNLIPKINPFAFIYRSIDILTHNFNHNNINNSKKNISAHYDLSNQLYMRFLDKSMTYSSALFLNLEPNFNNLYQAQKNKYERIIRKLNITNGNILEIGCGWGGFCQTLINNISVFNYTGITISTEQYNYCIDKFKDDHRIKILLIDYRNITGVFDYIISIEMIEAVGHEYLNEYFSVINNLLSNNGKVMIQAITLPDIRYEQCRKDVDFIQKYIFPGGLCPSISAIVEFSKKNNLIISDINEFGYDYHHTLLIWLKEFQNNFDELKNYKFDNKFYRIWTYYMIYCSVGFKNKLINVNQILFKKY